MCVYSLNAYHIIILSYIPFATCGTFLIIFYFTVWLYSINVCVYCSVDATDGKVLRNVAMELTGIAADKIHNAAFWLVN